MMMPSSTSDNQRCNEKYQKQEEDYLGDTGCRGGNACETENGGDNRYNKKHKRPI